jgi:hypothetical protein
MKSLIKNIVVVAVLFSVFNSNAKSIEPNPSAIVNVINSRLINLNLNNFDGKVAIQIIDKGGVILYRENYLGKNSSKKYDLSLLPYGDYVIELESETKIQIIPFSVNREKVKLNEVAKSVYFKPVVRVIGNLMYISKLSLNDEAVKIAIYDTDSNLLFEENHAGAKTISRILDISNFEAGDYSLVINSDGRKFSQAIKK